MAYLTSVYTNSLSNQNLSSAVLLGTFTNTTRVRKININVFADQIAGNGDYVIYATLQRSGSGSAYEVGGRTTVAVPSGVTAQAFPTISLVVDATDVVKVYLVGLAGDTTTPDTVVDVYEEWVAVDSSGQVTVGAIANDAINASAIADNAIDAGAIASNAITSAKIATDAIGAAQIAADAIGSSELAASAVSEIQSGLSTLDAAGVRTAVGLASANLDTQLSTIDTVADSILDDTGTSGVVVANGSKSGYALAATGLDSITATDPGSVASTFPQMVVQLWRRFFKKSTLTATELKTYADDGSTVRTTQTVSDDGTTQTQGEAS